MVETRTTVAECTQQAERILTTVLGQKKDSALQQALVNDNLMDIQYWSFLSDSDLNGLRYKPKGAPQELELKSGTKMIMKIFRYFIIYKRSQDGIPPDYDGSLMTEDDFIQFKASTTCQRMILAAESVPAPPITGGKQPLTSTQAELEIFRKGIKRDPALYPVLKEDSQWESWNRSVIAIARAQNVEIILDHDYAPGLHDEQELFKDKQKYMYAVFERCLQSDKGKSIVRAHESTYNAQLVYKEIVDYSSKSTKALIESADLLSYITSIRLGDGTWKGSTHTFILHWEERVRQYEKLVPVTDHFSESIKLQMLQNAVFEVSDLRQVKQQSDQMATQSGKKLTYNEYVALLSSAAAQYDKQFSGNPSSSLVKRRKINIHEMDETMIDYSIDTPVTVIQANKTVRREAMMPGAIWGKLSENEREVWDKLSDETKMLILNARLRGDNIRSPFPKNSPKPGLRRDVNVHDLILAYEHLQLQGSDESEEVEVEAEMAEEEPAETPDNELAADLLAFATNQTSVDEIPAAHLAKMLSNKISRYTKQKPKPKASFKANVCIVEPQSVTYTITRREIISSTNGTLIDGGSNGGLAGTDMRTIEIYDNGRTVDVEGIGQHRMSGIPLGSAGGVVNTHLGPIIAVFNNYAIMKKGKTIHSVGQLEANNHTVYDKSIKVGGRQSIHTFEGYVIPLNIRRGLPYMSVRPFTDDEWDTLPHVIFTSEGEWDPSVLDNELEDNDDWYEALDKLHKHPFKGIFDLRGDYSKRELAVQFHDTDQFVSVNKSYVVQNRGIIRHNEPDFESLRPNFGWLPTETIKETYKRTTQYVREPVGGETLKKRYKSPHPALNVFRREEPVAMDTVYSDVPAIDDGSKYAQIYVGLDTTVTDVYGMKSEKELVNTLEDNIRDRGAMKMLISDGAQSEISKRIMDILRTLFIPSWQSEPYQQNQNPAERRIQDIKRLTNKLLDRTGSLPSTWLLAMMYVCYLLNHTFNVNIGNVPLAASTGQTPDISPLLQYSWWEPVYFRDDEKKDKYPSEPREHRGRFVGIAEHTGHKLTYKILTDDTRRVVTRSRIRSALNSDAPNLRLDPINGESIREFVKFREDSVREKGQSSPSEAATFVRPIIDPSDLIGRSFLKDQPNGERARLHITQVVEDHLDKTENNPDRIRFLCKLNDEDKEELIAYNEILEYLESQEKGEQLWQFRRITGHEGPLDSNHPSYKGSRYNVMIEWENGEITSEPLNTIASDDPVTCAIYGRENGLLDLPGWKRFKTIAKREKKYLRMVKQAKLRSYHTSKKYMYGFEIPRDYNDAMRLDRQNGNTKWIEAIKDEMTSIQNYEVFRDHGSKPPSDHHKIRVHFVFAVKHDGRHKARLVADGHLTSTPLESVYSGVVSLRGIRVLVFLAELNDLQLWATDVGNAYLEATTSEKLYIIAGPEFGELQGNVLVFHKALYGLRTSGKRWHERFAECLQDMGFTPCIAEPDIWMRPNGDVYEYVGVYVDDLAIVAKNAKELTDKLINDYGFKLKGTGPLTFHLGCDFVRDPDGTLCMSPTKYIQKVSDTYKRIFGTSPPHNVTSPLEKGDHPEMDTSELLDEEGIKTYQSLIGSLQWAVSLTRLDIATAVMTMSSFRAAPRVGHLERVKRIVGFLSKMRHGGIRVRTGEPDLSTYDIPKYDWMGTIYGDVYEEIPEDAPKPLGKRVVTIHYVDANLMHDLITGKSVTAALHFFNQTPVDWFTKKQATVETATYGSEFVAARTCTEQIIELRNLLRYLGVPIKGHSYMFGDNQSVVNSSSLPEAKLHKRHTLLSFHRVREAIAAGILAFIHIDGRINPADILSKHWGYQQVWHNLQPLLFWRGDTMNVFDKTKNGTKEEGITKELDGEKGEEMSNSNVALSF